MNWWEQHKGKVYIGAAVTIFVLVPFGTFIAAPLYLKYRKKKEPGDIKDEKEIEKEK